MSNKRSIFLLLSAILVLALADWALRASGKDPRATARDALIDLPADCLRLVIRRTGCPDTVIERDSEWRLTSPFAGRVDEGAVKRVFDSLSQAPVVDRIADSELLRLGRTRADFALAEPQLSVTLVGATCQEEVSFGTRAPSSNEVYAAVSGVDAVFAVPTGVLNAVDHPADWFRRRTLVSLDPSSVASFGVKVGPGPVMSFLRGDDGWRLGDQGASTQKIRDYLADLTRAVADEFVWPLGASNETEHVTASLLASYGLELENAVTLTIRDVDGGERQVFFGKNAEEGKSYALIQDGGAIVTVPADLRERAAQAATAFTDFRLFPVEARTVTSLSVKEGETTYALMADADGVWRLESPIAALADSEQVRRMLDRVLALSSADVAKSGVTVGLSTNVAPVCVSRKAILGESGFEVLRSRELIRVDPTKIRRIVRIAGGKGPVTAVVYARDRKAWSVETAEKDGRIDEQGIKTVLAALASLKAERVERLKVTAADLDDYGLDKPYLTVAVDLDAENAVRKNVLVGGKAKGGRFATIGSSDAVFVLSDDVLKSLAAEIVVR